MSEYQYYEFCKIGRPLSQKARKEMASLSSRAEVGTHGASYVYNFGDFRGDPKKLLLKYFDVFFYISNFGIVQLMFKYPLGEVSLDDLKKHSIKRVIDCEVLDQFIVLDINHCNEDGLGWVEGEGMLPNLLPLYDEIKKGDYQVLKLVSAIQTKFDGNEDALNQLMKDKTALSSAQKALLEAVEISD